MPINRLSRLKQVMQKEKIDLYFSIEPLDFLYLLEFKATKGVLIVTHQDVYFFVDSRYLEKAKNLDSIKVLPYEKGEIQKVISKNQSAKIGLCGSKITYDAMNAIIHDYFLGKSHRWISIDLVEKLRMIKDEKEILLMRKACDIGSSALRSLDLSKQQSEWEVAQDYKLKIIQNGAETFAFDPIIAYDYNAAIPHHSSKKESKTKRQEILVDVGAKYEGYNSDMTMTYILPGADERLKEFYQIVRDGYYHVLDHIKLGSTFHQLNELIVNFFKKHHVDQYFLHSLGHNIGLDVHEAPFYKNHPTSSLPIQENMIFTVEPGLYHPEIGGVRLENTILMTAQGPESLTKLIF